MGNQLTAVGMWKSGLANQYSQPELQVAGCLTSNKIAPWEKAVASVLDDWQERSIPTPKDGGRYGTARSWKSALKGTIARGDSGARRSWQTAALRQVEMSRNMLNSFHCAPLQPSQMISEACHDSAQFESSTHIGDKNLSAPNVENMGCDAK